MALHQLGKLGIWVRFPMMALDLGSISYYICDMKPSEKGDIGVTSAMADLSSKGYYIFLPIGSHQAFDLIAYKDKKSFRLQVKYRANGILNKNRAYFIGGHKMMRPYEDDDFDYYALYLPNVNAVIYPSIKFKGCKIATKVPKSPASFYWYKDFLDFTDAATKKTRADFGHIYQYKPRKKSRKVIRPLKDELQAMVWEKPTVHIAKSYGVSDKSVSKWCDYYGIKKPPRGYWAGKRIVN
jgi:hypothetical protein